MVRLVVVAPRLLWALPLAHRIAAQRLGTEAIWVRRHCVDIVLMSAVCKVLTGVTQPQRMFQVGAASTAAAPLPHLPLACTRACPSSGPRLALRCKPRK